MTFFIWGQKTHQSTIFPGRTQDTSLIKATRNMLLALLKSSLIDVRFQDRGDCYVIRLFGINGDDSILEL